MGGRWSCALRYLAPPHPLLVMDDDNVVAYIYPALGNPGYLLQNLSSEDTLSIDNITGWEDLPDDKRDLLAPLLLAAVQETTAPAAPEASTVGPVNPTDLALLLARIPSDRERHTITTRYPSPSRSSTVEPPEAQDYETKCYYALLHDGCRPLFPISLLAQVETSPDARQTPSFSAYLEEYRRDFEMDGAAPEQIDRPEFEQTARRLWEREYDYGPPQLHDSPEAVFSRNAEAARSLLADHGFVQAFRLQADSEQQDQWTTYVEYLAFECYLLEKLDVAARKLQKKPSRARKYQTARAEIEAELKAAGKSDGSSLGRSRKRKLTDYGVGVNGAQPPVEKPRRTHETEKMVAGRSYNVQTIRSKKRKLLADEDPPEPKLKIEVVDESNHPRTRSRKRRKGIHERNGDAAPGTVLQSSLGAAVVSTVTTRSRPRQESKHERLKTLRPRANGKAVSVRGLKTRGG
ncbi:MAG: hypothetical protein Q9177_001275 [Variospora cf. flavescens]